MLHVEDIHVEVEEKSIIAGLNLKVNKGEIHAIMGPNGAGKSTFAKVLAGHPFYEVKKGKILFKEEDLLEMEVEERSHRGLFMGFQYPLEIAGITNFQFLFSAKNASLKANDQKELSEEEFKTLLVDTMKKMNVKEEFLTRDINASFSGGEKKKNEILQMAILNPSLAILDETDSGLDIDAMKVVADGVNALMNDDNALILITHYQRLLNFIKPDFIHVMIDGKIVESGGFELALELEEKGYDRFLQAGV